MSQEREIAQALLSRNNQEMYGVRVFEFEEFDAKNMLRKERIKLMAQVHLMLQDGKHQDDDAYPCRNLNDDYLFI